MNDTKTVVTSAFDLTLCEHSETLRLSTDAVLLSAYVRRSPRSVAMELGAGNGTVSLLLAKRNYFQKIYSVEIQSELVEVMKSNVTANGLTSSIAPVNADIRFINPEDYKGVSVVFANPPYMKEGCGKSSQASARQIARHEVYGGVYDFCRAAKRVLKTGGRLYLVYRPDRLETLMHALKDNGFTPKRMTFVHSDILHSPSAVLTESTLGGGESLTVTPPLLLSNSEDVETIYGSGVFPERFLCK